MVATHSSWAHLPLTPQQQGTTSMQYHNDQNHWQSAGCHDYHLQLGMVSPWHRHPTVDPSKGGHLLSLTSTKAQRRTYCASWGQVTWSFETWSEMIWDIDESHSQWLHQTSSEVIALTQSWLTHQEPASTAEAPQHPRHGFQGPRYALLPIRSCWCHRYPFAPSCLSSQAEAVDGCWLIAMVRKNPRLQVTRDKSASFEVRGLIVGFNQNCIAALLRTQYVFQYIQVEKSQHAKTVKHFVTPDNGRVFVRFPPWIWVVK